MLLATFGFCKNIYAIKGTFYNSISNNTDTNFWSGMEYARGSDPWDNCGWWKDSGWANYLEGVRNYCYTNTAKHKSLDSGTTIGQTGGHESNRDSTSAHQTFFLEAPRGTRKFTMWNDVSGKGEEHLYIKMWCSDKEVYHYETKDSYGADSALFIKTIFLDSATANKVDVGYIVMKYSPKETNRPDMEIDLFNPGNGLSDINSIGYKKECF